MNIDMVLFDCVLPISIRSGKKKIYLKWVPMLEIDLFSYRSCTLSPEVCTAIEMLVFCDDALSRAKHPIGC